MTMPQIAPYGSWRSPITADLITSAVIGLGQIAVDGDDIYWSELRPTEAGRTVVVRRSADGTVADVTPPGFNVRTRVHEYGGGAFAVADGTVYFSNFSDQRLYRQRTRADQGPALTPGADEHASPQAITPEGPFRYADAAIDRRRSRLICVREEHSAGGEPINALIAVDLNGRSDPTPLVAGNDFYASPRLTLDGSRVAWLTWNHPNMPWDGCELWGADLDHGGAVTRAHLVAGGEAESIFQPEWAADGTLYFVTDKSGWWNLYRWIDERIEALAPMRAEFGLPQWNFAMSTFAVAAPDRLACAYSERGTWHLASVDTRSRSLRPIATPYTDITSLRASGSRVVCIAGSPAEAPAVVAIDLDSGAVEVIRRSHRLTIVPDYLSVPEAIEFATQGECTAHAFYYPPRNPDYVAPADERPPLVVMSHGGPTAAAGTSLNLRIQYWTSRGIAVLDVNYGGSTGYGRAYRERLNGQWGIVDVDDCVNGALALVRRGVVDGHRLAIRGGSAGGYTTLCALTFRDVFRAGASYYGIGDLEALARDTHKFESRYEERLVGPYPACATLYRDRSPIHFTHRLACPVIFFQGLDDKVVPPNQAEMMVAALRAKGLPVAYVPFEGEQHGFRRAENIKRALEAELYFYSRVFGFAPAEPVEPVAIENL
jgi:dipeptidyl aminopeptidase/acylaminoacyl peptidase